ncbi:hypothetical protein PAXRUDRAFT_833411 [Paxillus rubicundulus Ve08.2h10]|uniref:Uncharacterized protein n=1 Tax=Paxillus rubicundulus Ve08.2h10 TaxID=930991 RepID=A0A0D0DH06_9AGAM|nr:hypothetical protein PAXRUDRAFT_833411 [Paxillus rubicundulus Ve08.2h10]
MKTFLTLLAVITYLNAYTLVGVHAKCAICPSSWGDVWLRSRCTRNGTTNCVYQQKGALDISCHYNDKGSLLNESSHQWCPQLVETGYGCVCG